MLNAHQYIVTLILPALFKAEHRRLEAGLVSLHRANKAAHNKPGDGFIYQGDFYVPKGTPKGARINLPAHPRMQGEIESYIADKNKVGEDSGLISQLLFKLLEPCFNHQDIRCAVPESIIDTLPVEVTSLSRCRQPTFFLNHPSDFRLYDRVLPIIEYYSALRLMY